MKSLILFLFFAMISLLTKYHNSSFTFAIDNNKGYLFVKLRIGDKDYILDADTDPVDTRVVADESLLQQRKIHPYDLYKPETSISQVVLTGNNYDEWSRELCIALRARKKFGFIDGTIKRPAKGSNELEDWWTINSLLVTWIRNSIEPSLRRDVSYFEVAKDLWDDLAEQFGLVNGRKAKAKKKQVRDRVHQFLMGPVYPVWWKGPRELQTSCKNTSNLISANGPTGPYVISL